MASMGKGVPWGVGRGDFSWRSDPGDRASTRCAGIQPVDAVHRGGTRSLPGATPRSGTRCPIDSCPRSGRPGGVHPNPGSRRRENIPRSGAPVQGPVKVKATVQVAQRPPGFRVEGGIAPGLRSRNPSCKTRAFRKAPSGPATRLKRFGKGRGEDGETDDTSYHSGSRYRARIPDRESFLMPMGSSRRMRASTFSRRPVVSMM